MEEFKEFQGKSLDEAIRGACSYFDASREKLEIDIVQDAKNGIFGLVGARKAIVRARRAQLKSKVGAILNRGGAPADTQEERKSRAPRPPRGNREVRETLPDDSIGNRIMPDEEIIDDSIGNRIMPDEEIIDDSIGNRVDPPRKSRPAPRPGPDTEDGGRRPRGEFRPRQERPRQERPRPDREVRPDLREPRAEGRPEPKKESRPDFRRPPQSAPREQADFEQDDALNEGLPSTPFNELDQAKLTAVAQEVASTIINAILGETPVTVRILENRVDIHVDCGDDSGLLIGREGQTLAALQYVTSRIVSRRMEAPVRIQFDVGDYRERQDDRLRELALSLAERVRATGRPCSTRPMSSYHRRLVHMALQDSPDVQTRSSGEGPLKRVIIQRRRQEKH